MTDFIQDAFNSGEICEEALSRRDIAQAGKVVRWAKNGFFMVQGGWRRRKGTWYVAPPKAGQGDYLLVPFTRASGQSVMLEIGNGYGRVYGLDRQRVGTVEFGSLILQAELASGVSWLQTGDVLIQYRRNGGQPQAVKRHDTTDWECVPYGVINGPFLPEYQNDGATLTIGATSLSASAAVFAATDVGSLVRVKHADGYSPADGWRSGWAAVDGEPCYYAGNYYQCAPGGATKTGYLAPVHTSGTRADGNAAGGTDTAGRNWTYKHDGASLAVISGYTSPTLVSVAWVAGTAGLCTPVGSATGYWAMGAYSDTLGWPTMAPCIREKRIVTGGTLANPDTLDLTRTNGWAWNEADYKPGMGSGEVVADDAMRLLIGGNGAALQWAAEQEALFVATTDGLYSVTGGGVDVPLKPDSVLVREIAGGGSSPVLPAKTPKSIIYTPPSRRGLMELTGTGGDYNVAEISLLFQHITGLGVAQVLYMRAPWHQLVLRLNDGSVAFVNYHRDQNVLAAARQDFGGRVFTLAVVAGSDGEDQLWMGIERNGVRGTEVMSGFYEDMYLDSAQIYSGAATANITGLARHNGLAVQALADGVWHQDLAVAGGAATLQGGETAGTIVTGLGYTSRLEFMPLGDAQEAWADRRFRPNRARITGRFTICEFGSTDDKGGDSRFEKEINRGDNGKWTQKRTVAKVKLISSTEFDKRVVVQTVNAPFDTIIYSAKIGVDDE